MRAQTRFDVRHASRTLLARYSKSLTHRNRLAGGSQSISKCAREIEPTVSQFLNVHGKFSESGVSIGLPPVLDN